MYLALESENICCYQYENTIEHMLDIIPGFRMFKRNQTEAHDIVTIITVESTMYQTNFLMFTES